MKYNDFLGGLVALAFVSMPLMAVSQDFEDDIYYNPSKEKTTKSQKVRRLFGMCLRRTIPQLIHIITAVHPRAMWTSTTVVMPQRQIQRHETAHTSRTTLPTRVASSVFITRMLLQHRVMIN